MPVDGTPARDWQARGGPSAIPLCPPPPPPGLCLKGRWAAGAVPERLHSGHRGCDRLGLGLGGGFWRLEMRLGLVSGYGNAFRVESGQWGGGRGVPPPFQAIPCPPPPTPCSSPAHDPVTAHENWYAWKMRHKDHERTAQMCGQGHTWSLAIGTLANEMGPLVQGLSIDLFGPGPWALNSTTCSPLCSGRLRLERSGGGVPRFAGGLAATGGHTTLGHPLMSRVKYKNTIAENPLHQFLMAMRNMRWG